MKKRKRKKSQSVNYDPIAYNNGGMRFPALRTRHLSKLRFMFLRACLKKKKRKQLAPKISIVNSDLRKAVEIEIKASQFGVCTWYRSSDGYIYERDPDDGHVFRYKDRSASQNHLPIGPDGKYFLLSG